MDQARIAEQLMVLYGKLRRATAPPVRDAIKAQIDELIDRLERERHVSHPPVATNDNQQARRREG
jgi:hypothetical protein